MTKPYLYRLLLSLDQLANVALLNGSEDETISSHCWHHRDTKLGRIGVTIIDTLFSPFEQNHCKNSYEADEEH